MRINAARANLVVGPREGVDLCVCVCVRARARVLVHACACECACECARARTLNRTCARIAANQSGRAQAGKTPHLPANESANRKAKARRPERSLRRPTLPPSCDQTGAKFTTVKCSAVARQAHERDETAPSATLFTHG